jgi:hypothetical protein
VGKGVDKKQEGGGRIALKRGCLKMRQEEEEKTGRRALPAGTFLLRLV